jgi:transposase
MLPEISEKLIARQTPEAQAIIRLLLAHIAQQNRLLSEQSRRIAEQDRLLAEQDRLLAEQARRMAELESRLDEALRNNASPNKTPRNSSLPPGSQHPHAKPPLQKPKSKLKRGGQPGHDKHARALIPPEECTDIVPLKPAACRRCGSQLHGDDPQPLRHQVWELPEIQPLITEYQRHRLTCTCGTSTCAELPAGVPTGQSGPRLVALSAMLMALFRQSKRRTALFISQVLHIPCSPGLVVKHQNLATQALRPAYDELVAALPREPHLNGDESPTKEGSAKAWLWTLVARKFTVFSLRTSRSATALDELIGQTFTGVMSCDRAKMYWQCGRLQWCWAHLKRDVQALIDHPDRQVKRLGHDLMPPVKELFRTWSRCRDGTLTRRGLGRLLQPIRHKIEGLLLRGRFSANARLVGMCRELYEHRDWLWTFANVEGVEPTNNAAERALRPAVIWRKLSFGTQSSAGSRFVETCLTVIETCRQQHRNTLAFVTNALTALFHNHPRPSLLARP